MLDKLKNLFAKKPEPKAEPEVKKVKEPKPKKELSEKEKATINNEPYVAITRVEINPDNIHDGAFELDWNEKFIVNLIKAGYKIRPDDTDEVIADRWLQQICRTIALEMYEGTQTDPENRDVRYQVHKKKLDNGRTEVS
jgi:hypothetical protein